MVTLVSVEQVEQSPRAPVEIEVPASTAWPLVLAFGSTLMFAGLLTSVSVSVLGVVLAVAGCGCWFPGEFPYQQEGKWSLVFSTPLIATPSPTLVAVTFSTHLVVSLLPPSV